MNVSKIVNIVMLPSEKSCGSRKFHLFWIYLQQIKNKNITGLKYFLAALGKPSREKNGNSLV